MYGWEQYFNEGPDYSAETYSSEDKALAQVKEWADEIASALDEDDADDERAHEVTVSLVCGQWMRYGDLMGDPDWEPLYVVTPGRVTLYAEAQKAEENPSLPPTQ